MEPIDPGGRSRGLGKKRRIPKRILHPKIKASRTGMLVKKEVLKYTLMSRKKRKGSTQQRENY